MNWKHYLGVAVTIIVVMAIINRSAMGTTLTNTAPKSTPPLP